MANKLYEERDIRAIADAIRIMNGATDLYKVSEMAAAILTLSGNVDMTEWVHKSVGATFPPAQLPASDDISGSDIDIMSATADDIYAYIDAVANSSPDYAVKETLGKDASSKYDMVRYTLANRQYVAWRRRNYPKMYAWRYASEGTTETVPAKANIIVGQRYSHSGGKFSAASGVSSVIVPLPPEGIDSAVVTLTGMTGSASYGNCYGGTTNALFPSNIQTTTPWSNSNKTLTVPNGELSLNGINYIVFFIDSTGAAGEYDGATITLNGEVIEWEIATTSTITAAQESTTVVPGSDETIYSTSVSPRIGDTLYSTPYIGTAHGTVTAVNATNRSRTVGGAEYIRFESGDIEPTVIYTNKGDAQNSGAAITQDGVTYDRYPLGDLGTAREKLTPIFVYANEHGISPAKISEGTYETKMCALIAARFVRDLCSGANAGNALYKYIRENCMVIVIPVANPFGFNLNVSGDTPAYGWTADGYYNYSGCNINRNYDTPGWDVMNAAGTDGATMGAYAGSETETQYIMNTMVESGAAVAMSLHGLGAWEGYCAHQGQQPDGTDYNQTKLAKVAAFLQDNYGYILRYYDTAPCMNMPSVTSKSPSYITQSGAYGGIVEMSPDDVQTSGWAQEAKSNVIENAYAQMLNLAAMWLSDYLES